MSHSTIQPQSENLKKAIREFSELVAAKPEKSRKQILQQISIQFDLSPNECLFLERQCLDNENKEV